MSTSDIDSRIYDNIQRNYGIFPTAEQVNLRRKWLDRVRETLRDKGYGDRDVDEVYFARVDNRINEAKNSFTERFERKTGNKPTPAEMNQYLADLFANDNDNISRALADDDAVPTLPYTSFAIFRGFAGMYIVLAMIIAILLIVIVYYFSNKPAQLISDK